MELTQEKRLILEAIKQELEQTEETGYSQWVMAVAVAPFIKDDRTAHLKEEIPTHTARVILKTNTSP